jgi:putative endonuclease
MKKGGAVYILTNVKNTVLYVGVTSNLRMRVYRHRNKFYPDSFTAKYRICKLVYYFSYWTIDEAIAMEKKIKGGSRKKKIDLVESMNPEWKDLYEGLF